jgi:glycosyltransferase involved in cell wall biosynthesis
MLKQPLVSIIMNCFNGEQHIKEAIDSVYCQTYSNWEIIFWDNASSDNSYKIASSYDTKVRLFKSQETTSLGEARRNAIKNARGEWLAFLDVDDVWLPKKLECQMEGLINSNYILSYCGIAEVDQNLNLIRNLPPKWESGEQFLLQLQSFEINLVTSVINKQKLIELNIDFDERMQASEEYDLFLMLLSHGGSVFVCKDILALYRVHNESLTYKKIERWSIERRITLEKLVLNITNLKESEAYKVALRQADYYEACFLMTNGNQSGARALLIKHKIKKSFRVLAYITYLPWLWKTIHNPSYKKRLTNIFESFSSFYKVS